MKLFTKMTFIACAVSLLSIGCTEEKELQNVVTDGDDAAFAEYEAMIANEAAAMDEDSADAE